MINLPQFLDKYYSKITYDGGKFITVEIDEVDRKLLEDNGISYDTSFNKIDIVSPFNNKLYIYYDLSDFAHRYTLIDNFEDSIILILGDSSNYSLKCNNENSTRIEPILNYHNYKLIINLFLTAKNFISFHDSLHFEFVLISTEKGVNHIKYDSIDKRICAFNELPELFNKLSKSFEREEFQAYFKDIVLETIPKHNEEERFYSLIVSLAVLIDLAERDFQIYIRKFAFEKIKTKFKEERNKYFESIEKNIDSINKQVLAFPLTFSATIFASYQVKSNAIVLILIFFAYSLYTLIAFRVLNISRDNISFLKKDINYEKRKIENSYELLYKEFKPDFDKVLHKINQINYLILILKATLFFLLLIFVFFVVWYGLNPIKEIHLPENILTLI